MFCDRCGAENRDDARFCHSCGGDLALQRAAGAASSSGEGETQAVGTVIANRYCIEAEIGRGGMGIVYKAIDRELERPVALKVLHPRISDRPEAVTQLREEALAAMRLTHGNIVRLHNFENAPDAVYLLMEYVPGQSLAKMLSNGLAAGFTERDVVRIAQQVCDALIAAHKAGVIHRDIKPSNILLTPEGDVKIVDLGIASAQGPRLSQGPRTSTAGTPTYMAPEQFRAERVDGRTDLYALGVTLYEVLASHPPFVGSDLKQQHLEESPEPIPGVSDWLNEIVLKCLAKAPRERWATAEALRQALDGTGEAAAQVQASRELDMEPEWRRVARERERRETMRKAERKRAAAAPPDTKKEQPAPAGSGRVRPQRKGALPPAGPVTPANAGSLPGVVRPATGMVPPVLTPLPGPAKTVTGHRGGGRTIPRVPQALPQGMAWGIPDGILQFMVGSIVFALVSALGMMFLGQSLDPGTAHLAKQTIMACMIGAFWGFAEIETRHLLRLAGTGLAAGLVAGCAYMVQNITPDTPPLTLLGVDIARALCVGGALGAALGSARGSTLAVGLAGALGAGGGLVAALTQAFIRIQGWYLAPYLDAAGDAILFAAGITFGAVIGANAVRVQRDRRMRL